MTSGWVLTSEGGGVVRVRPGEPGEGDVIELGRLLEESEHRVVLATDLQRWPTPATTLARHRLPVVAAIGASLEGDSLLPALAADIRIAAESIVLSFRAADGGPIVDRTIITLLGRLVGAGTAGYWLLTRREVAAAEARAAGLAHEVVAATDVDRIALDVAYRVATGAPLALEYAKEALRRGTRSGLLDAIEIEGDLYSILHTTADRAEGVQAFLEHRDPHFRGQ